MIRLMLLSTLVLLIIALLIPDHVRAQDELPRVLILGDSIYNGPARELSKELKGQVTVVYRQLPPASLLIRIRLTRILMNWSVKSIGT